MKILLLVLPVLLLTGCGFKSATEIRSDGSDAVFTSQKKVNELSACMVSKFDDRQFGGVKINTIVKPLDN